MKLDKVQKQLATVILIGILCGLATYQIGNSLAVSGNNTTIINKWSAVQDCTYFVFTDNTNFYAKNCDTGSIDYSGTSAHIVFNNAITAIDSLGGGTLFVKSGLYPLTSNILIGGADNLKIVGENRATTVLQGSGNPTNLIRQVTTPISNFTIQDIELDGNNVADIVVYFSGGIKDITFNNVYAHHSDPTSGTFVIFFDGTLGTNSGIRLLNSHFAYSGQGFDIVGSGGSNYLVDNNIFENEPGRSGEGFAITNGKRITITNNQFRSFVGAGFAGNAIHTENSANEDIIVSNNYFHMYTGYAVDIGGDTTGAKNVRFVVSDNIIDASPARATGTQLASGIQIRGGLHGTVSGNTIYNTTRFGVQGLDVSDLVIDGNTFIDASWANFAQTMGDTSSKQGGAIQILNSAQALSSKSHISITDNVARDITTTFSSGILVDNQYSNVYIKDNDLTSVGSSVKIYSIASSDWINHNSGFVTEARGNATLTTTSLAVAHGLSYTPLPQEVNIVFKEDPTTDVTLTWITTNSTHFIFNSNADPGSSDLDFGWSIQRVD